MRLPGYVISLYLKSNTSHPGGWKKMKDPFKILLLCILTKIQNELGLTF